MFHHGPTCSALWQEFSLEVYKKKKKSKISHSNVSVGFSEREMTCPWRFWNKPLWGHKMLTFFLSACPFFRSLFAMITPTRRVSNTGSLRLAAAGGMGGGRRHHWEGRGGVGGDPSQRGNLDSASAHRACWGLEMEGRGKGWLCNTQVTRL